MRLFWAVGLILFLSINVWAINGNLGEHDGYTPDGSENSSWRIEDVADFLAYCDNSSYWAEGTYTELTADLDLAGHEFSHSPIGYNTDTNPGYSGPFTGDKFEGSFDGNNHTISNLTINGLEEYCGGLFGYIDYTATVQNVIVNNVSVSSVKSSVGCLAGYNWRGTIINCGSSGKAIGTWNVGGLVGHNGQGTITECYSYASVMGQGTFAGLVGKNDYGDIINCYAMGKIISTSTYEPRGLVDSNSYGNIENCYSAGWVLSGPDTNFRAINSGTGTSSGVFWDRDTAGTTWYATNALHTVDMQSEAEFLSAGWDFAGETDNGSEDIWQANDGWYHTLSFQGAIPMTTVPDVAGQTISQARSNIAAATLCTGLITYEYNDTVAQNNIISQSLTSGSTVAEYFSVDLVVSYGPEPITGSGTEGDPYIIDSYDGFVQFINDNKFMAYGVYIELTTDLDLNPELDGRQSYTESPIGDSVNYLSFCGSFNGNGHVIRNYVSTDPLFMTIEIDAQVHNLGLEDIQVTNGGGFCGYNAGLITNCYTTGSVSGGDMVGGFVEYNYGAMGGYAATINNCYSTCTVNGEYQVGGFVGYNFEAASITNCYSTGAVTGDSEAGGFCGLSEGASIVNCYSTGLVNIENSSAYGFCGWCGYGEEMIENCFWDTDASGNSTGFGNEYTEIDINGKTTTEMKNLSTFTDAGWDFDTIWVIQADSYPQLSWQPIGVNYTGETSISIRSNRKGSIQIEIFSSDNQNLSWNINGYESINWITSVIPTSGSSTGPDDKTSVTINIDAAALDENTYNCLLQITDNNNRIVQIPIELVVYKLMDMEKLAELAQYWQMNDCSSLQPCSAADWYIDQTIDMLDLQQLAISWLETAITYDAPVIQDGFETNDFSKLNWQLSGTANWITVSDTVYEGSYAAKSGNISHNQSTTMEFTTDTTGFDQMSFWYKVSSESSYDFLYFYIDGNEQNSWSGIYGWTQVTFPVTDGSHTFTWTYKKDGSVSSGSDSCWIDNIEISKK